MAEKFDDSVLAFLSGKLAGEESAPPVSKDIAAYLAMSDPVTVQPIVSVSSTLNFITTLKPASQVESALALIIGASRPTATPNPVNSRLTTPAATQEQLRAQLINDMRKGRNSLQFDVLPAHLRLNYPVKV